MPDIVASDGATLMVFRANDGPIAHPVLIPGILDVSPVKAIAARPGSHHAECPLLRGPRLGRSTACWHA